MWNEARTICVVFNGEIYNFVELRDQLVALGSVFTTSSDTEVLIEAYRIWGIEALRRFRGMFAFVLWDVQAQTLLLARDAFGKKPIFIAEKQGALVFGSEIEPLLQFPGINRSIDPDALGHYLINRYVPGPSTFFKEVKKLQPGCYLIWKDGQLTTRRYFIPPLLRTKPDIASFEDAVVLLRETFDEAVRIRMRSDAPFGAYLSGGIDSSAVLATMSRHSAGPVRTFSVGFRESAYSELGQAREIAQLFGADHHELIIEPRDFEEHWTTAVLRRGAPVSEASDIPILMLSHAASRSVKMVLTGEGSDEMLGGYPKHRADRWVQLYQALIPQFLHDNIGRPLIHALPYGMRRVKIAAMAAGQRDVARRMQTWFGGLADEQLEELLGRQMSLDAPDSFPFSIKTDTILRRMLFFDQTSWLPDNLLERGDRMMMAGSIEGRMPFMDTALAEVAARLPDKFLIGAKGGKAVLRAMMSKTIPDTILKRKKVGFRVPFNEWFRGIFRDLLYDMLSSDRSQVARVCCKCVLDRLLDEHVSGRQNHERILWTLVNLEMFFRIYKPDDLQILYIGK
jgi:asparagine synthase (glutamine-hydrolysing)